jgi:surface polysaccharide O-acyltransferase-like enzyme
MSELNSELNPIVSNPSSGDRHHHKSIDFLRVISAFAVVWLHVSATVVFSIPNVHSINWWVANFADAYSRWCVPIFVMIGGALLLSSPSTLTPIQLYRKRLARLLPPMIVWTLVFIIFRKYTEANFNSMVALNSIVKGVPAVHLWYLYMLVGLYAIAPFLRSLVTGLDRNSLRLLMFFCFTISAIDCILGAYSPTFLSSFIPFIGYFLAGYYFFSDRRHPNIRLSILIILVCGLIVGMGTGILLLLSGNVLEIMYSNHNPVVVVMSICIFHLLIDRDRHSFISAEIFQKISAVTLGVYAIHPLWLWGLSRWGINGLFINSSIGIPVTTFIAFLLSVLSASLMANIPYLRRLVS